MPELSGLLKKVAFAQSLFAFTVTIGIVEENSFLRVFVTAPDEDHGACRIDSHGNPMQLSQVVVKGSHASLG